MGTAIKIEVDTTSAVPAYEQIRSQVTTLAASGRLPAGSRLPSIRQLAGDLELAPGTIARAYRVLEQRGIVSSQRRRGTVVNRVAEAELALRVSHLRDAADLFAHTAATLNIDREIARIAVEAALRDLTRE